MDSLWFKEPPATGEARCVWLYHIAHKIHEHGLPTLAEVFHCSYYGLLFMEGGNKWYVWTALPILVVTVIAMMKGGE